MKNSILAIVVAVAIAAAFILGVHFGREVQRDASTVAPMATYASDYSYEPSGYEDYPYEEYEAEPEPDVAPRRVD